MKKLLIVQHTQTCNSGTTIGWCQQRGIESVLLSAWLNPVWPTELELLKADFLGVVLCGGGMNVDQEFEFPWLQAEKKWLHTLLKNHFKTLGLCLGAQLMAEVLGASVGPHSDWEIGWHPITLTPHPALPQIDRPLQAFQWHRYIFQTPAEAVTLGQSEAWPHQAFLYKNHGLGFQFHPEVDPAWVRDCAQSKSGEPLLGPWIQPNAKILSDIQELQPILQSWYWQVLDGFFNGQ